MHNGEIYENIHVLTVAAPHVHFCERVNVQWPTKARTSTKKYNQKNFRRVQYEFKETKFEVINSKISDGIGTVL